jgi:hypothetical protein
VCIQLRTVFREEPAGEEKWLRFDGVFTLKLHFCMDEAFSKQFKMPATSFTVNNTAPSISSPFTLFPSPAFPQSPDIHSIHPASALSPVSPYSSTSHDPMPAPLPDATPVAAPSAAVTSAAASTETPKYTRSPTALPPEPKSPVHSEVEIETSQAFPSAKYSNELAHTQSTKLPRDIRKFEVWL